MTDDQQKPEDDDSENGDPENNDNAFGIFDLLPFLMFIVAAVFFAGAIYSTYTNAGKQDDLVQGEQAELNIEPVELNILNSEDETMTLGGVYDGPRVVNFFASWCQPCKVEHPLLMKLAEVIDVPLVGVAYSDKQDATNAFLEELGNPYSQIGVDNTARTALGFGIRGIPATYVLDSKGRVVWRYEGPITQIDTILDVVKDTK